MTILYNFFNDYPDSLPPLVRSFRPRGPGHLGDASIFFRVIETRGAAPIGKLNVTRDFFAPGSDTPSPTDPVIVNGVIQAPFTGEIVTSGAGGYDVFLAESPVLSPGRHKLTVIAQNDSPEPETTTFEWSFTVDYSLRDVPNRFTGQEWLAPKENACGLALPDSACQMNPTAEWANHTDESFEQCNAALNGGPITAINVRGEILTSRTTSTIANQGDFHVLLLRDVPLGSVVDIRVRAFASSASTSDNTIFTTLERVNLFHCKETSMNNLVEYSTGPDYFSTVLVGQEPTFQIVSLPGAEDEIYGLINTSVCPYILNWVFDVMVRLTPGYELPLPRAIDVEGV